MVWWGNSRWSKAHEGCGLLCIYSAYFVPADFLYYRRLYGHEIIHDVSAIETGQFRQQIIQPMCSIWLDDCALNVFGDATDISTGVEIESRSHKLLWLSSLICEKSSSRVLVWSSSWLWEIQCSHDWEKAKTSLKFWGCWLIWILAESVLFLRLKMAVQAMRGTPISIPTPTPTPIPAFAPLLVW